MTVVAVVTLFTPPALMMLGLAFTFLGVHSAATCDFVYIPVTLPCRFMLNCESHFIQLDRLLAQLLARQAPVLAWLRALCKQWHYFNEKCLTSKAATIHNRVIASLLIEYFSIHALKV